MLEETKQTCLRILDKVWEEEVTMRERKERIVLTDNINDVFIKLAEGNFGALSVLKQLMEKGKEIDPDCGGGEPLLMMLHIDSYGIYGPKLWMLYKDVCSQNISKAWACIRACQYGLISESQLHHAIENRGEGIDVESLCNQVKENLPNFKVFE